MPVLGIEWPEFKVRFSRMKEAIEIMRRLWSEDFVSFEGEYFKTHNATLYDRPDEPVPLYIAASGAVASRLTGRVADGFICTSGKGRELYEETLLPAVREGADKASRDYDRIEKMVEIKVSFDRDRHQAMEDTRIWAALALPAESKMGIEDPREMERLAAELPTEKAASRWLVSDDPEETVMPITPDSTSPAMPKGDAIPLRASAALLHRTRPRYTAAFHSPRRRRGPKAPGDPTARSTRQTSR